MTSAWGLYQQERNPPERSHNADSSDQHYNLNTRETLNANDSEEECIAEINESEHSGIGPDILNTLTQ